ncbi:MAG: hypothetical protein BWZ10_02093 [candidate division BRC1 bacterium ADurb.BinA364]|nr:MAG: hypothetical protein BWZ10_02093 [candidate division BRC1 bacterium ADurb.BinA364]
MLQTAVDSGSSSIYMAWQNDANSPAQFLGFAYDLYKNEYVLNKGNGTMWHPFPANANAGFIPVDNTGGYFAWISNQYANGDWYLSNAKPLIVYSGMPNTPANVALAKTGSNQVKLTWKPDIFGAWHAQVIFWSSTVGWNTLTTGPDGTGQWHFLMYGTNAFMNGEATFTVPEPATYHAIIRFVAWNAQTVGELAATGFVDVN